MVPSPPERSGKYSSSLPYIVRVSENYSITSINPSLPETFSCQFVVNGVPGPIVNYSNSKFDKTKIWESGAVYISAQKYPGFDDIDYGVYGEITINTLDVYIDGVKMNITQ